MPGKPSGSEAKVRFGKRSCQAGPLATRLSQRSERQRSAIALVHFQELTNIAAAETLEISVEALESLLARGRRALKASLAHVAQDLIGDADGVSRL